MKKLLVAILVLTYGIPALAIEAWTCIDGKGNAYQSEKNVLTDTCSSIEEQKLLADATAANALKEIDKPAREGFCLANKNALCEEIIGGIQRGTLGNVAFRIYSDSAAVAASPAANPENFEFANSWQISCNRDKMSKRVNCFINRGALYVFSGGGADFVSVGTNHFPRSTSSIKVGNRRFDTSHHDGNFGSSKAVLTALRAGGSVVTRYMKWPYRTWEDDEFAAFGFDTALQITHWLVKHSDVK